MDPSSGGSCSAPPPPPSAGGGGSRQFLFTPLAIALTAVLVAILLKRPSPASYTTQSLLSALKGGSPSTTTAATPRGETIYNLLLPNPYSSLPAAKSHPQTEPEAALTREMVARLSPLQRRSREVTIESITIPVAEGGGAPFSIFGGGGGNTGAGGGIHARERLMQTLHSLTTYKSRSLATLDRKRKAFSAHHLPRQSKHLLAAAGVDYLQKIRDTEARILANAGLCERILGHALGYYGVARAELDAYVRYWKKKSPGGRLVAAGAGGDHTSLTQALKHYVRDFSSEGRAERDVSFRRALRTLEILYPSVEGRKGVRVLVPGCGVGGLLWRVARMGFVAEGVEWSYYMNVVGHYVGSAPPPPEAPHSTSSLEGRQDGDGDGDADADVGKNVLYPYLDWWSHHATTGNMLRGITFPYSYEETGLPPPPPPPSSTQPPPPPPLQDHPSTRIFLHEGDFLNLANLDTSTTTTQGDSPPPHPQPLQYPTILTLFFIDTARDITSYITTIHALLAPGGVWINFGPLLYGTSPYLELSLDEVVKVAEEVGFVFERLRKGGDEEGGLGGVWYGDGDEEDGTTVDTLGDGRVVGRRAGYSVDWRGLGRNEYLAQGWVARKKGGSVGE